MFKIKKIELSDIETLLDISYFTFVESHGHSASEKDMNVYLRKSFSRKQIEGELKNEKNIFNFIYYQSRLAGYSKLILNFPYEKIEEKKIAKLERIYLKKEFYDLKLGLELLNFNINYSKAWNQKGMWLYSWIENKRGLKFYETNGFKIIDNKDFKISRNHSNPNYIMYLKYY